MSDLEAIPKRIQLRRTKGWRKPLGAVVVSRPSRWGNPFILWSSQIVVDLNSDRSWWCQHDARAVAVRLFRDETLPTLDVSPLRGSDLCCWCPPEVACHADVLLAAANAGEVANS